MSKELALGIVIGSTVTGALNGIKSVIGGVDSVGKAIETLNKKKFTILEKIEADAKKKLEPLNKKLSDLADKKRVIRAKVNIADDDIRKLKRDISSTKKEIDSLNKKKIALAKKFKEGSIGAKAFNRQVKEIEDSLNSLGAKRLNLENKLAKAESKGTALKRTLKAIDRSIDLTNQKKLKLRSELSKAKEEATKTNKELLHIEKRIESLNKHQSRMQKLSDMRDKFRARLIDTVAIGATVSAPIKVAIDYESAFADVRKVVNFANKEEEKAFSKEIVKLSTKIPLSAEAIAAITASGGQLGIAKAKLLDFTKSVAKMKVAFDMSASDAGESIAKLMNIYALSVKEVNTLGDAINHLSDNTAAKAKDIVNVLARVGGTAKMFGLSAKEAASLADAFLAMGKPPEVAATAINAMLNKLNTADKQGKKFQKGLEAIGFSAKGLKKAIAKDANGAILMFLEQIKKFDKQKQMGILSDLFGMEYSDDIALLISGLDNYKKALKLTANKQNYLNSMQKEFENRSNTTENKLQLLKNSLNSIAISVGTLLLPAVKTAADWFKWLADKVEGLSQKYPTLTTVLTSAVVGLGAFSVATAIGGYAISVLGGGVLRAISAFGWLKNLLFGGLGLRATAAKANILSASMYATGRNALFAKRNLASLAKTAIGSIGGILALGSAFIYLNSAIAGAAKADIDSKRVMNKGLAKLKEQEQYLKERIKATKEGSLIESFLHGSNDKYKLKELQKRLEHTQKQIRRLEEKGQTPEFKIPKVDIPAISVPVAKDNTKDLNISNKPLPVNVENKDYKELLNLAKSGANEAKKAKHKTLKSAKQHKKSGSNKTTTSGESRSVSSRGGANTYNINIALSGTNESLVSKLESLLPAIIKDIEADNIGRAMYDS